MTQAVEQLGIKSYVAKQLTYWLYNAGAQSYDVMTNISKDNRRLLAENYEIGVNPPLSVKISIDGTKKYLFKTERGNYIETAFIPDNNNDRNTLCVSSEAGCKMGCAFCYTAKQGFQEKLSVHDIINQLNAIPERNIITNIVFMGMGEPFDNYDNVLKSIEILTSEYGFKIGKRKITVSTVGIVPGIKRFLNECDCNLAISLHSPFEEERSRLIPMNDVYHISDIMSALREHDWGKQRFPSFEYIMFKGINDSDRHIKGLCKVLNGMRCLINLIQYHSVPGDEFQTTDMEVVKAFRDKLSNKGFSTTIRASRGLDIEAACGLLSTLKMRDSEYSKKSSD